jgi:hypothetical protein
MSTHNALASMGSVSDRSRAVNDFYATHPFYAKALLLRECFHNVWEPACGMNHIAHECCERGCLKRTSDVHQYEGALYTGTLFEQIDFMQVTDKWDGDIITNPPFNLFNEFMLKCLSICDSKAALFAPIRYLASIKRWHVFKNCPPKAVYVFSKRYGCARDGVHFESGPVDYCWIVWENRCNDTRLYWI